uniref:C2H2-type domain-containing protein n=1 Tax=Hyaloperonospora arabidopsidis (strain Emoy2) TaxID=559515 RepID=M4B1Z8_HYAAE
MDEDELTEFYPLTNREEETPVPTSRPDDGDRVHLETVTGAGTGWTTSRDHVALQFFWQGCDAFVTCKDSESVAPCFYNAHCAGQCADSEFVQLVPVNEVRERHILDAMRVQLVSVDSDKYLRATHVSKYLKWSRTRDEQTVFVIQIADRKPLTASSKFTLTSCFWPDRAVGFTQTFPLGGGRDVSKAIGFLTLEKRKKQAPLLFPIRFRAVLRAQRDERPLSTAARHGRCTPFVTAMDMLFIADEDADRVSNVPLARVAGSESEPDGRETVPSRTHVTAGSDQDGWESCTFCGVLFRARGDLIAHIRDGHGEMLHRVSVPGAFCIDCGTRRVDGRCTRCSPEVL